jgi:hypothetical protein
MLQVSGKPSADSLVRMVAGVVFGSTRKSLIDRAPARSVHGEAARRHADAGKAEDVFYWHSDYF